MLVSFLICRDNALVSIFCILCFGNETLNVDCEWVLNEGRGSKIYLTYVLYKFKLILDSDSDKFFFLLLNMKIHT